MEEVSGCVCEWYDVGLKLRKDFIK
jgi:hypothetical protein